MKRKLLLLGFAMVLALASCTRKDAAEGSGHSIVIPEDDDIRGVFVLNEGNFTYANSSLSYYDIEADTVANNIFFKVNDAPIGDVGQSLARIGNSLYIVVNNSKFIYKVDATTIEYQAILEGFSSPRFMLDIGHGKAYVSDLAAAGFWVVNTDNFTIKKFVATGKSTECMVRVGDEVFVSNWSKAYVAADNNTIQVIDCENDSLVKEIVVATEPNAMVVDKHNHIWVSCSGGFEGTQDPSIICVDAASHEVIRRFDLAAGSYPSGMAIDGAGENVFFMNGGMSALNVYKMSVDATELPDTPFITSNSRLFYGLKVNPQNGDIYITDAKNYVSNGDLLRYSAAGTLIATASLGIIPSYMLFN